MDRSIFLKVWLLCGTLDAAYASVLVVVRGSGNVGGVWRGVASGPFGAAADSWGPGGVVIGLCVHFAIMAAMVGVGLWLAHKTPLGDVAPWKAGTLYGLALYTVMYGIVLPQRFGVPFPNPDKVKLALALLPHIVLVGIPMFLLFRRRPPLS